MAHVCCVAQASVCTLGHGKHSEGSRRWQAFVSLCPGSFCPAHSSPAQGRVASPSLPCIRVRLCHLILPLPMQCRPLVFSATGPWADLQQCRPTQRCERENGPGWGCWGLSLGVKGPREEGWRKALVKRTVCNPEPAILARRCSLPQARTSQVCTATPPGAEPHLSGLPLGWKQSLSKGSLRDGGGGILNT